MKGLHWHRWFWILRLRSIGDTLLEEPEFREEYGLQADAIITFYDVDVSVHAPVFLMLFEKFFQTDQKKKK